MSEVINTLVPVFLVIGLGYFLAKRRFLSESVLHELNQLLFWGCLPALIVGKLATAREIPDGTGVVFSVLTLTTLATICFALWIAPRLGLGVSQIGTFVQASFRGNLAFAGLPIILFAFQSEASEVLELVLTQTLFVFAPTMLVYNVAAVVLLVRDHRVPLRQNFADMLQKVVRNPLILASVLGAILFGLDVNLPLFALSTLDLTGQMAAPAALLCVGGSMVYVSMEGRYRSACVASLLKVVIAPIFAYWIATFMGLNAESKLVLLILSACPTAVASYVMAKQMNGDEALASGAIIISTVACIPSLALIVALN